MLKPFRSHGWLVDSVNEIDRGSYIEIHAAKGGVTTRMAVLYSSSEISNTECRELSERVDHIFFSGQPYRLDSFAKGVSVPVEPLGDFFPFLVELNKQVEPARSAPIVARKTPAVRRLTAENPHDAVMARLQRFTSVTIAKELVERRVGSEGYSISREITDSKATGIAYLMRSAPDYLKSTSSDKLNRAGCQSLLCDDGGCSGGGCWRCRRVQSIWMKSKGAQRTVMAYMRWRGRAAGLRRFGGLAFWRKDFCPCG